MLYHTNSGDYTFTTILLDLNGTLTVGGVLDDRLPKQIEQLINLGYEVILLTGDQRGTAEKFGSLGIKVIIAKDAQEKKKVALSYNIKQTVAIGNARIDKGMFDVCALRIATLQAEGIHSAILGSVDIIVPSIADAFNLLLDKDIFAATMKI